jgi:hypothetical protein
LDTKFRMLCSDSSLGMVHAPASCLPRTHLRQTSRNFGMELHLTTRTPHCWASLRSRYALHLANVVTDGQRVKHDPVSCFTVRDRSFARLELLVPRYSGIIRAGSPIGEWNASFRRATTCNGCRRDAGGGSCDENIERPETSKSSERSHWTGSLQIRLLTTLARVPSDVTVPTLIRAFNISPANCGCWLNRKA